MITSADRRQHRHDARPRRKRLCWAADCVRSPLRRADVGRARLPRGRPLPLRSCRRSAHRTAMAKSAARLPPPFAPIRPHSLWQVFQWERREGSELISRLTGPSPPARTPAPTSLLYSPKPAGCAAAQQTNLPPAVSRGVTVCLRLQTGGGGSWAGRLWTELRQAPVAVHWALLQRGIWSACVYGPRSSSTHECFCSRGQSQHAGATRVVVGPYILSAITLQLKSYSMIISVSHHVQLKSYSMIISISHHVPDCRPALWCALRKPGTAGPDFAPTACDFFV